MAIEGGGAQGSRRLGLEEEEGKALKKGITQLLLWMNETINLTHSFSSPNPTAWLGIYTSRANGSLHVDNLCKIN